MLSQEQATNAGFELLSAPVPGGSGAVHRARHGRSGATVALKLLAPGGDPARVRREARALAALEHPNVVRLVETGRAGGLAYLATEWIDGEPLHRWIARRERAAGAAPGVGRALSLIAPIADALDHAHRRGVVHGDIGPRNIVVSRERGAVLIDFGIGRLAGESTVTARGDLAGTPRYLAPETIRGAEPAPASDAYALALLLYEVLAGRWPFTPGAPTAATALHHQLYSTPEPLSELRPDLPTAIDAVFAKALDKSPRRRFGSATAFVAAVGKVAGTDAVNALERSPGPSSHPVARTRTSRRRRGRTLVVGIAAAVGALAMDSWWPPRPDAAARSSVADNCNLYPDEGFDGEPGENFYRDAERDALAARIETSDVTTSPVLKLGDADVYGLHGVIVPVHANRAYTFATDLTFHGYVHTMSLRVLWLDRDWQTIDGAGVEQIVSRKFDGRFSVDGVVSPPDAHHAVPTLYKDASAGVVHADNLVFAPSDGVCEPLQGARA